MSVPETTKLLEETRAIVYDQSDEQPSIIPTLLTQMNSKLSNTEMKNNFLYSRLSIIESKMNFTDELENTLKSMKCNINRLEEDLKSTKSEVITLESSVDSIGKLFDSVKEHTISNHKSINDNKKEIKQCQKSQLSTNLNLQNIRETNNLLPT